MSLSYLKNFVVVFAVFSVSALVILPGCKSNSSDKPGSDALVVTAQTTDSELNARSDTQKIKSETIIPPIDSPAVTESAVTTAQTPQAVEEPGTGFEMDSTKKYVYLTFDDGPQPGTMNVYHTLKSLGVKGTFFMVGLHETYGKTMRSVVDTIRDSYPEILLANHSYTHANGHYMSFYHHKDACFEDFMKAQKSLGVVKKYIRLPGNSGWVLSSGLTAHSLVKPVCRLLDSAGYSVFGWDAEWSFKRDPSGSGSVPVQSADKMVAMIENALNHHHTHRKNAVVLLTHDRMFHRQNYMDSLYKFIHVLKTKHPNYVFETVENYPGAKH
ncbi:MAG TPA: polysaccharide deacetylase family protein [Arachidicoccus sp.]|nr:polysaccharide deacetylase family protein [Arachidicoccus sp.]